MTDASPSDLPAREAIEGAAHKLEKVRRWFKGRLQGKAVGDPANALVDLDQALAALQPLSQGTGEAPGHTDLMVSPEAIDEAIEPLYAVSPPQPEGVREALQYATHLAETLAAKHYADVPQWKPLPSLIGVLSQIDNMTTGLTRALPHDAQSPYEIANVEDGKFYVIRTGTDHVVAEFDDKSGQGTTTPSRGLVEAAEWLETHTISRTFGPDGKTEIVEVSKDRADWAFKLAADALRTLSAKGGAG